MILAQNHQQQLNGNSFPIQNNDDYMNKIKFLVFVLFLTFTISCSQQKRYITYKVKEGETMRDIASRLDVKTKDLLKLNPDVGRKPNVNTTIIIPNPNLKKEDAITNKDIVKLEVEQDSLVSSSNKEVVLEDPKTDNDLISSDSLKVVKIIYEPITHTVEPKETVYGLTKEYNISKDELLNFNPEYPNLKNNELSIGQVLKVGEKEVETWVVLEEDLKSYVTHTVKAKETVYGLTRFYNISKEELIRLNPHYSDIKDNSLQIGQVLKIRTLEEKIDTDEVPFYHDTIALNTTVNLAVLLPFKSKEYNSVKVGDIFKGNKLTNMVTDFYMGLEIAVDSVKQQGVNVNVSVFDSGNRGANIQGILNEGKLDDANVIIGPFYSNKVGLIASKVSAPVVFPHFSNKQNEFSSNRIVKSEPDIDAHTNFLSSYLKENYNGETIFVVGDDKKDSERQVNGLVTSLKKHDSINKVFVLKPEDGYIKKERFTDQMKPKSHSWLIIISDDNVVVEDAVNSMIVLPEEVTSQVFSIKKNKAYDNVDNNKLARIGFAHVTNSVTDDKAVETKLFVKKYKKRNYDIPSEYSIKGFDVAYDVLMRLASGEKLFDTFNKGASVRLETKFDYEKNVYGAKSNKGLFIVKYNSDLSLKRLK